MLTELHGDTVKKRELKELISLEDMKEQCKGNTIEVTP